MTLDLSNLDLDTIPDPSTRDLILALLNACVELLLRLAAANAEVERLAAEVARLKGEHPPRP
jgi:hypothetical protein